VCVLYMVGKLGTKVSKGGVMSKYSEQMCVQYR
jgi:hypothetical protein